MAARAEHWEKYKREGAGKSCKWETLLSQWSPETSGKGNRCLSYKQDQWQHTWDLFENEKKVLPPFRHIFRGAPLGR